MPTYTTESGVYNTIGFTSDILQKVTELPEAEITILVNTLIDNAEADLKEDIRVPYIIRKELHLGTGYDTIFELGPYDEEFSNIAEYDPTGGLEKVLDAYFSKYKKQRPYPADCDEFTEFATAETVAAAWAVSGGTVTTESTEKIAGSYSIEAVFSGAGYIQYPKTGSLDRQIGKYTYLFFWLHTTDKTPTFTVRIYDTDGNYKEQAFTPRYSAQGQFFWLNLAAFTGSVNWGSSNTRLQSIRIYTSGACTVYIDNLCLADEWAYTAPIGYFHIAKADNITGSGFPSHGYPFYATYSYDPFGATVPNHIKEATEWLTGVKIVDHLRAHKYGVTDFYLSGDTMEPDTPMQKSGMLGIRTKFLDNYNRCLKNYGGASYGVV